jgi:hypothetical protein
MREREEKKNRRGEQKEKEGYRSTREKKPRPRKRLGCGLYVQRIQLPQQQ